MNDLVSVFVPVYNISSRYPGALERFIDSVGNQTYTNIEVILVDDCSTDDSGAICERQAAKDSRFRVVHHSQHLTINKARETSFRHCKGPLVYNADPDDLLHPQAIEIQHALLTAHPECQMVATLLTPHFSETAEFTPIGEPDYEILGRTESMVNYFFKKGAFNLWNRLYRRELLETIDFNITMQNDFDLSLQIWLNCQKVVLLKNTTYYWIQREQSASHNRTAERFLKLCDTFIEDWQKYILGKHPELYGAYLFRMYNVALGNHIKINNPASKKASLAKIVEMKSLTWSHFTASDVAAHKKAAMWWLMHFPEHKLIVQKVHRFLK